METIDTNHVICNGNSMQTISIAKVAEKATQSSYSNMQSGSTMNWLIYTLYARQEYDFCLEIIEKQLQETYDKEFLYFYKALIARANNDHQESLRCLQATIELDPQNPDNFKEIGKTLFFMGRWKQSLDAFMKAETLLQRPDQEIYHFIGELLYRNKGKHPGRLTEAKDYFHRAIQYGKPIESYQRLVQIYREEKNYPKAIEMLENSLQINPDNADTLSEIGVLYLKVNDTKNAFDRLFDVIRLKHNCFRALIALGAILQSRNDNDGALNKYKSIEKLELECPEVWSNIGLCFSKKRKLIAAISCLKKATWMSPLNFNCLYNLGMVYIIAQQYASAYQTLACAINLRPDSAESYMLLGIVLKNLNDLDNAYLAMEKSAMLPEAIKNPLIYLNFAIFCADTERFDQAWSNLDNFNEIANQTRVKNEYLKIATRLRKTLPAKIEIAEEAVAEEDQPNNESGKNVEFSDDEV